MGLWLNTLYVNVQGVELELSSPNVVKGRQLRLRTLYVL